VALRGLVTIGETLLDYGASHSDALNVKWIGSRIGRAMGRISEHMEQVVPMEDSNTICADEELLGGMKRLAYNMGQQGVTGYQEICGCLSLYPEGIDWDVDFGPGDVTTAQP
jgi:hypothetical protein